MAEQGFSWLSKVFAKALLSHKLEQLECLRSEDTPHHLMITHTIESYWIPKSKEDKVKVTNLKNLPKFQIF